MSIEPTEEATTDEPTAEEPATESPEPDVASFKDKYTYTDGVQVEVTKIRHGKVTAKDVEQLADDKAGTSWVQLTVRVRNGSKKRLKDVSSYFTVTYGPDGDEAEAPYVPTVNDTDLSGTILPGKAKVGSETYRIPPTYQNDVTLEFTVDSDHDPAIFTGSLK